jgi:hypothetical protein
MWQLPLGLEPFSDKRSSCQQHRNMFNQQFRTLAPRCCLPVIPDAHLCSNHVPAAAWVHCILAGAPMACQAVGSSRNKRSSSQQYLNIIT